MSDTITTAAPRHVSAITVAIACIIGFFAGSSAFAQTPPALPTDQSGIQQRLKTFDPTAVEAARHYYQSPSVKADLFRMVGQLTPSIIASVEKDQARALNPPERLKIATAVEKAANANFDLLIGLNMVASLETLSKDELVALDQFYSSPVGQSILAKTPRLNQRLPGIFEVFGPKFSSSVETEIKAVMGPG